MLVIEPLVSLVAMSSVIPRHKREKCSYIGDNRIASAVLGLGRDAAMWKEHIREVEGRSKAATICFGTASVVSV